LKKLVINNVFIIILVMLFFQFNGSMMGFIYFNPAQSFFTRANFLQLFLYGLIGFVLISGIAKWQYTKMHEDNFKRVYQIEISILFAIAIVSSISYVYVVFYPTNHIEVIFQYVEVYKTLVVWYMFEFCLFVILEIIILRRVLQKR